MKSRNRFHYIKTFWAIANQIGKEFAYDVVERLYDHRSLRALTLDELARVVAELQEKAPEKRKTYKTLPKKYFKEAGYALEISDAHRGKISVLKDQAGVSETHFLEILDHVAKEKYIGPKQAGKIIGALESYMKRLEKKEAAKKEKEKAAAEPVEPWEQPYIPRKPGEFRPIYYEHKPGHG